MNITFELIDEYSAGLELREQIRRLLLECFPDLEFTQRRSYFKQLPQKRLIARTGTSLIGHIGIEHRVVGLGEMPAEIVGFIDVAVTPELRRRGIASEMISRILHEYSTETVEFAMLFADNGDLYQKHGFRFRHNQLNWLKIHEHKNYGIGVEHVPELMTKELSDRKWTDDSVDLLGYLF